MRQASYFSSYPFRAYSRGPFHFSVFNKAIEAVRGLKEEAEINKRTQYTLRQKVESFPLRGGSFDSGMQA